ncbi:hypothetical protein PENTCL1PPCAC_9162, partial [Pristionchus entomophagus]
LARARSSRSLPLLSLLTLHSTPPGSARRTMSRAADKSLMVPQEKTVNRKGQTRRKASKAGTSKDREPSKLDGTKAVSGQKTARSVEDANKQAWSKKVLTLSIKTLSEEFNQKIKRFVDTRRTTICSAKNEEKNRYADVLCLDDTRVVLKGRKVEDDYIHANWVQNPDGSRLICTQGPMPETIEDFWLMAVKEKVTIIIQLCQFVEGEDEEKCAQYFPTKPDETKTFGPFKVTNLDLLSSPAIEGCVCSYLEITYEKKKTRMRHCLLSAWPDKCAPVSSDKVLDLWKWLKKNTKVDDPVIVHCSAGVGRTATFAAIELAAYKIGKNPNLSLMKVIKEMRSMRYQSVQSHVQYLFLHLCMLDLFCSERIIEKYDPEAKFIKDYRRIATRNISKMAKKGSDNGKNNKEGGVSNKKVSMLDDDDK